MAYSRASTVKYIKAIGTYSESELTEAIGQINDSEGKLFFDISRKIHEQLKGLNVESVDGKKTETKRQRHRMSQMDRLQSVVQKIECALDKYESTDEVDSWDVSFAVGMYYGDKTFAQITDYHNRLINAGCSVQKLKLLNFIERGRLYDFLKKDDRHGAWGEVCESLAVCRRTVDRYIDFFHITNTYPRLIICELSFETIMTTYMQLNKYLDSHDSLSTRLQLPLKQTRLCGGGIFSSRRMPGGGDETQAAPQTLQTEDASWDAAWQLADELFDNV